MTSGLKPVLSVCIPTYNRAALLRTALDSIVREFDGADIEVIVSDNASSDNTEEVVHTYQNCLRLRYNKNATNVGLDNNAVACIKMASGEYAFMFSDDDVLLPGSGKYLLHLIEKYKPNLVYLNHQGFWETEEPDVVCRRRRSADRQDVIYRDGFEMLLDLNLSHFSAIVFRRAEAVRHFYHLEEYQRAGYERGYAAVFLAHYVVLESAPPFVFAGKCCVAVRNVRKNDAYNVVLTTCIDRPRHYQNLRKHSLLSDRQLQRLMNKQVMWPTTTVVLRLKSAGDPRFSKREARTIWQLCKPFPLSYIYILPVLVLPRAILVVPCFAGLSIQWLYRKITRRSVFE